MFGLDTTAEVLTLVSIMSGVGTLVFSVTPKGLALLVKVNNWLGENVFNTKVNLRLERVEKYTRHISHELGIPLPEDEYHDEQTH